MILEVLNCNLLPKRINFIESLPKTASVDIGPDCFSVEKYGWRFGQGLATVANFSTLQIYCASNK